MEEHIVRIESIVKVTHDVLRIVTQRPCGYSFAPGQATDVSINRNGWREEKRPFTFTSLPREDYLEFTIKTYPERKSVTNELLQLRPGDELIVHEVFGAITYKGPGLFIAGGAGVTPFICIFKSLQEKRELENNRLLFANKTRADIIDEQAFSAMLGAAFINILSDEKAEGYYHGRVSEELLKTLITGYHQQFYVCGPPAMMDAVLAQLTNLGVENNAVTIEI